MSADRWLPWTCDEDCETVWIRADLARLDDLDAVRGPRDKAGLADVVGLGKTWPHMRLIFDHATPMVVVDVTDEGGDWFGIQPAHPDEDADVCVYHVYYATEDAPEPGDVVFGAREVAAHGL